MRKTALVVRAANQEIVIIVELTLLMEAQQDMHAPTAAATKRDLNARWSKSVLDLLVAGILFVRAARLQSTALQIAEDPRRRPLHQTTQPARNPSIGVRTVHVTLAANVRQARAKVMDVAGKWY